MERLNEPSTVIRDGCTNGGIYADGKPVARHTYNHLEYLPNEDVVFMWGGSQWQCGYLTGDTWFFNLPTLTWTKKSSANGPTVSFGRAIAYDPNNKLIYARDDFDLYSYNPANNAWTKRSSSSAGMTDYKTGIIDPIRKRYYLHTNSSGATLYWYDISSPTASVALQSGQTLGCSGLIGDYRAGWAFDPTQNKIVGWNGGNTVYILNPDTLTCTTASYSGGPATVPNGTFGRFRYVPSLNIFVVCNSVDANCYTLRLTSGSAPPSTVQTPTVSLTASSTSVPSGSSTTLTWSSSNTNSCTASGGWSGTKAISGSQSTGNLTATTAFTLTCTGSGGSASQSATVTVASSTAPTPTSSGTPTLLVKFGKSSGLNTFGLSGWSAAIKDVYTDYQDIGPGGTTIVTGDNYTYNYQGVTGTARNFLAGETVRVTWYNSSATTVSFTPNISFTDPDRIIMGASGTWYPMTSTTVPASGSAISEYKINSASAGTYSLVNVNVNYANTRQIVAAKIELITSGSSGLPLPAAPIVLLSVSPSSITSGASSTLTWSSTNASSCSASGSWSGTKASSGSQSTGSLSANATFTLTCTGTGGSASQSATVTVASASPPSGSGSADFQARCAMPGVLKCVGFDSQADITGTYGDNHGILPGAATPSLDSTVKASGSSAIKFTIPSNSGANSSGSYFTNFSDNLSTQFGPNSEFYIQWRQRFSPEFLNTLYQGGGGWKHSIIGTGDKPGCSASNAASSLCYSSCSALETVTQNTNHRGFPQMYNSCTGSASHGPYEGFEQPFNSYDFKLQNARSAPYCLYSQGQTNPTTYLPPSGNCFGYFPNEWMTFQVHIKTGPRVNDEFTNSFVQLWIAREGRPSELVFDWGPYNLSAGSASEDQRYGKIWLLPYNTGKSPSQAHPTAYTWYDELIISTSKIPDPRSTSASAQVPAPPTNLTVQ
jgi:hypothetical protein